MTLNLNYTMTTLKESQYCARGPISTNFKHNKKLCRLDTLELIFAASISIIFDVYVISPHISQITLKYVTKL